MMILHGFCSTAVLEETTQCIDFAEGRTDKMILDRRRAIWLRSLTGSDLVLSTC